MGLFIRAGPRKRKRRRVWFNAKCPGSIGPDPACGSRWTGACGPEEQSAQEGGTVWKISDQPKPLAQSARRGDKFTTWLLKAQRPLPLRVANEVKACLDDRGACLRRLQFAERNGA